MAVNEAKQTQENKDEQTWSISELAAEYGITPRSIRHYEDEKLIFPKREGSTRIYSRGDKVRLQLILRGKRLGFSLAEIRDIISIYDLPYGEEKQRIYLLEKIDQRRQELHQQTLDIQTMLTELDKLEEKLKEEEEK